MAQILIRQSCKVKHIYKDLIFYPGVIYGFFGIRNLTELQPKASTYKTQHNIFREDVTA